MPSKISQPRQSRRADLESDSRDISPPKHAQGTSPKPRAVVLIAVVVLCVMYADKAIDCAMPLMMCYRIYYIIWVNCRSADPGPIQPGGLPTPNSKAAVDLTEEDEEHTVAWPDPAATAAAIRQMVVSSSPIRPVRSTWRERTNATRRQAARQKFSELVESMLLRPSLRRLPRWPRVVVLMLRDQAFDDGLVTVARRCRHAR